MASNNSPPETPSPPNRRRSSIADLLQPRSNNSASNNSGTPAYPAMSSAMQSRQGPRRMSISTSIGLSASQNTQTSPFGSFSRRRDSISSSQESGSPSNESAIVEENEGQNPTNTPVSPFARRVSFGAQAFGSVRSGSFNGTRRPSFSPLTEKTTNQPTVSRAPSTKTQGNSRGEGFNWGDNLREKSGRPLQTHPSNNNSSTSPVTTSAPHQRSVSVAAEPPPKQMPVQYQKPDVLGERMLRGDFTMD